MAAGDSFELSDLDRALYGYLSLDPTLSSYAPGGFWAEHPLEGTVFPCVRWWMQSPGKDEARQDGRLGRLDSNPGIIVCMLDNQKGGGADFVGGTNGNLEAGAKQIYTLLHGVTIQANGYTFTFWRLAPHRNSPELQQGEYDVEVGGWYRVVAQ